MTVKDLKEELEKYDDSTRVVLVDINQRVKSLNHDCVLFVCNLNSVVIYTGDK